MQPDSETLKFLVVDDIGTGRSVLEAMLSRYGEVETASGGEDALSAYKEAVASGEMYDLLLLDIDMPGMDGITTLKKLREFERQEGLAETKTVMQTASSSARHPWKFPVRRGRCPGSGHVSYDFESAEVQPPGLMGGWGGLAPENLPKDAPEHSLQDSPMDSCIEGPPRGPAREA